MVKIAFQVGDVVVAQGRTETFKVLRVSPDGKRADIQAFSVSKRELMGPPTRDVPCSTLRLFKEDTSQTALRVVREATEES